MAPHFFTIFVLGLFVEFEARSILSSSSNEAVLSERKSSGEAGQDSSTFFSAVNDDFVKNVTNVANEIVETTDGLEISPRFVAIRGLNLEKILAEFAARTANLKDYENRTAQWLKLLKEMLDSSSSSKNFEKSNDIGETRTFLIDDDKRRLPIVGYNWLEELFEFLDEQDIDGRDIDVSQSHVKSRYENSSTLFPLNNAKSEETEDTSEQHGFEQLDKMLVNVESEIQQFRKYFEKICSKHRQTASTKWQNGDHRGDRKSSNDQDN